MTTLAEMTPAQRYDCVGMWCDYYDGDGVKLAIIVEVSITDPEWCMVYWPQFRENRHPLGSDVVPRLDLPRAWTPDGTPPDGEWLAHGTHTRVIPNNRRAYVTMSEPEPSQ